MFNISVIGVILYEANINVKSHKMWKTWLKIYAKTVLANGVRWTVIFLAGSSYRRKERLREVVLNTPYAGELTQLYVRLLEQAYRLAST